MTRTWTALAALALALAAFAAALAFPTGRQPDGSALEVELSAAFSPYGQRMLVGTVPALADRLEIVSDEARVVVSLRRHGELDGPRRHVDVPLPAGAWQAEVFWAEHRLGGVEGRADPSSARADAWPYGFNGG